MSCPRPSTICCCNSLILHHRHHQSMPQPSVRLKSATRKSSSSARILSASHSCSSSSSSRSNRQSSMLLWTPYRRLSLLLLVVLIFHVHHALSTHLPSPPPVFTEFSGDERRVFQDVDRTNFQFPSFFHTMYIDPTNDSYIYIGALDFIYRLSTDDISFSFQRSVNITEDYRYLSDVIRSQDFCRQIGSVDRPEINCRNHIRAVFPVAGPNKQLYVCSTGAYNPQEFYLNAETLEVVYVRPTESGRARCPYDPTSIYAAAYVVSGNPFNEPSLYTAVSTDSNSVYVGIIRPTIPLNSSGADSLVNLLRTDIDQNKWINTAEAVHVVAVFDIGQYVYYFFREIALESTAFCSKTYYSRVARVCKNDEGGVGLNMEFRFTSFLKARLVCSTSATTVRSGGAIPYHFNEIYAVQYNSTSETFYVLFMANSNGDWGSAVCVYAVDSINSLFDHSAWVEQNGLESAWLRVPDSDVPTPRPGQCSNNTKSLTATSLSFIKSHPLMMDVIEPQGSGSDKLPIYFSKELAFSRLAVDRLPSCLVLYLYRPDNEELHRVASYSNSGSTQPLFHTISIWKPFSSLPVTMLSDIPSTVWSMKLLSVKQIAAKPKTWLYVTSDVAVVQLNTNQCPHYAYCTDCVQDPYCGWDIRTASCRSFHSRLFHWNGVNSDALSTCQSSCKKSYMQTGVIAGMALHLNCSSNCRPSGDVRWTFRPASDTSPAGWKPIPVGMDNNYILSRDGGLVVMVTSNAEHAGTFRCLFEDIVLAEHRVTMSGCEYGDNVRDTFTKEYVRWCKSFDDYNTQYKQWLCLKKKCIDSNCVPNISECN